MHDHELVRHALPKGQVLFVTASCDESTAHAGDTNQWLPELAVPYYKLVSEGYDVTIASLQGGRTPFLADTTAIAAVTAAAGTPVKAAAATAASAPDTTPAGAGTPTGGMPGPAADVKTTSPATGGSSGDVGREVIAFLHDDAAVQQVLHTVPLRSVVCMQDPPFESTYAASVLLGGPEWTIPLLMASADLASAVARMHLVGRPVAAVGNGVASLVNVHLAGGSSSDSADGGGRQLLSGQKVAALQAPTQPPSAGRLEQQQGQQQQQLVDQLRQMGAQVIECSAGDAVVAEQQPQPTPQPQPEAEQMDMAPASAPPSTPQVSKLQQPAGPIITCPTGGASAARATELLLQCLQRLQGVCRSPGTVTGGELLHIGKQQHDEQPPQGQQVQAV